MVEQKLRPHILRREVACHCGACDGGIVRPEVLDLFERIRHEAGDQPITITSGYRCQRWNASVGGVPNSYHTKGLAIDMLFPKHIDKREFFRLCARHAQGTGLYKWGVHVDLGKQKRFWIDKSWKEYAKAEGLRDGTGQTAGETVGQDQKKSPAQDLGLAQKKTQEVEP